jgi:predicted metal-dependent hydrolase
VKLGAQLERRLKNMVGWMRQTAADDHPQQGLLFAPVEPVQPATTAAEPFPSHTEDELSQQQAFVHPAAQRRTRLNGHIVAYAFTRARRRSIGMAVGADGLSVRAPRWVTLTDVEAALQERASWIIKHLKDHQHLAARQQATRIVWRHGTTVPWLGEPLAVLLDPTVKGVVLSEGDHVVLPGTARDASSGEHTRASHSETNVALAGLTTRVLRVGLPSDTTPPTLRAAVHTWMQRQARTLFEARVSHYAAVLGVKVTRLSIGAARTRWGSAGADGSVRLNWRLVHHDMACIDYVVVHELSHLRHMNHSPAFWGVVKSVLPDYAQTKAKLRAKAHDLHD